MRAIAVGVAMMIVIAIGSAATTWVVGNRIRTISSSQIAVLTSSERLQRQSEVLELSARLAVATGDEAFAQRYARIQPELRSTLAQLRKAITLPENRASLQRVAKAEEDIAAIEYRVLDLAVSDRREEARLLLESPGYRNLVTSYRSGLDSIQQRSRAYVQATRRETNRYLTINLATSLMALLLIGLAWIVLVRPARSWGHQIADASARARKATRAKTDFLAMMSHEIRTPLNSVIGFTDLLLKEDELNPRQRHRVELVHGAGTMLLTVVNDLLDFSKIEAGKIELAPEVFALDTLIDNSVSIVRGDAEGKGLELRVATDPCLPDFLLGDETRLRQVLLNLLNNAVKFTAHGLVSLAVAREAQGPLGERIRFTVTDTGAGIDPDRQGQLFQPFTQADVSITRRFGGTGLGLSISRRLVELMGGAIDFISRPGSGSSFWFTVTLPRAERPDLLDSRAPLAGADAQGSARILLAEDLPMNQELALAMLSRAGHTAEVANDGEEALHAVQAAGETRPYDLILMDIQMPRMDGITATRAIRALPGTAGKTPILAMTANVLPEQVREFLAAGMNGHVGKPVKEAELHNAIAGILAAVGGPRTFARVAPEEAPAGAFDSATFDEVVDMLPPERLRTHAEGLAAQAAQLAAPGADFDPEALAFNAHKLISQAGMLGLTRLSERARVVEDAVRAGEPLDAPLDAFREAAGDVADFVLPRLPPRTA
jgi:signal transduction histidine kinase/CheY-like chemotaxis protein